MATIGRMVEITDVVLEELVAFEISYLCYIDRCQLCAGCNCSCNCHKETNLLKEGLC